MDEGYEGMHGEGKGTPKSWKEKKKGKMERMERDGKKEMKKKRR